MSNIKLRRQIAVEAARLMYGRLESEYFTAKRKAAARFGVNTRHQPKDLPSNREIRDEIQAFARMHEGERRYDNLGEMRAAALCMMRLMTRFHPRLIGSVLTGHVRAGSDIDLHVFSHNASSICEVLSQNGYQYDVEHKRVIKHNEARIFTHVHVYERHTFELTVYKPDQVNYTFKSSITGKAIERASISELEELLGREHAELDLEPLDEDMSPAPDPYMIWPLLLGPLAEVKQDARWHPEGDALYHSLQAFETARLEQPYDVEMMTAALLHDVGKAVDAQDHVSAGLEALEGTLSEREHFLIANHMEIKACLQRSLSVKREQRLRQSEWFEDLMTLQDIDRRARECGVEVCTIEEAIEHIRRLSEEGFD